jgi:hypothetical protein
MTPVSAKLGTPNPIVDDKRFTPGHTPRWVALPSLYPEAQEQIRFVDYRPTVSARAVIPITAAMVAVRAKRR